MNKFLILDFGPRAMLTIAISIAAMAFSFQLSGNSQAADIPILDLDAPVLESASSVRILEDELDNLIGGKTLTIRDLRTNRTTKVYYAANGQRFTTLNEKGLMWELTDGEGIMEEAETGKDRFLQVYRVNNVVYLCDDDCHLVVTNVETGDKLSIK